MGFFDRFTGKQPTPSAKAQPASAAVSVCAAAPPPVADAAGSAAGAVANPGAGLGSGGVLPRLAAARQKLDAQDLAGALAIYDEVLAAAGDRADVLVTISGDLGSCGHVAQIVELVAPRYDAERHGPATGLNVLQAYLAGHDPTAAQHLLDVLFALDRPELESRLHGFSNALAELIAAERSGQLPPPPAAIDAAPVGLAAISLVSISKPIWFYGLEPLAAALLPPKEPHARRVAFAQLALPGAYADLGAAMRQPEDELGRLSRALPLWFAEAFYFSTAYDPIAAIGLLTDPESGKHLALFGAEWTTENLRQLVATSDTGLDYIFTGALRQQAGDFELVLRVWEVKKFRERKTFTARWTPATADLELAQLHEQLRAFMEWAPETCGLPFAPVVQPRAWLDTLGTSLALFLVGKGVLPKERLADLSGALAQAAQGAGASETASLACLTLRARAARLGISAPAAVNLAATSLVGQARQVLG